MKYKHKQSKESKLLLFESVYINILLPLSSVREPPP